MNNEKGVALALVLIVMSVLMVIGTMVIYTSTSQTTLVNDYGEEIQAFYLAESGADLIIKEWHNYIAGLCETDEEGVVTLTQNADTAEFLPLLNTKWVFLKKSIRLQYGLEEDDHQVKAAYEVQPSGEIEPTVSQDEPHLLTFDIEATIQDTLYKYQVKVWYYADGSVDSYKGESSSVNVTPPMIETGNLLWEEEIIFPAAGDNLQQDWKFNGNRTYVENKDKGDLRLFMPILGYQDYEIKVIAELLDKKNHVSNGYGVFLDTENVAREQDDNENDFGYVFKYMPGETFAICPRSDGVEKDAIYTFEIPSQLENYSFWGNKDILTITVQTVNIEGQDERAVDIFLQPEGWDEKVRINQDNSGNPVMAILESPILDHDPSYTKDPEKRHTGLQVWEGINYFYDFTVLRK